MKNRNEKITLVEIVTSYGSLNQAHEAERETADVFGTVDSVSQSEFFEGGRIGLQPDLKLVIYDFEYNGELIVKVAGKLYSVYRTYCVPGTDFIELYVTERGGTKDEPEQHQDG